MTRLFSPTLFRLLFAVAVIVALVMAFLPHPPHTPIDSLGDKFEHSLAFCVLAWLAAGAFPQMRLRLLAERLSFLGAMIEVVQSIPALHRDCDIFDWMTDTIAIGVALLIVHLIRRRSVTAVVGAPARI